MKSSKSIFTILLCASLFIGQQSKAVIALTGGLMVPFFIGHYIHDKVKHDKLEVKEDYEKLGTCLFLLPVCALEKDSSVKMITQADLEENQFSQEQIDEIAKDQQTVLEYMAENKLTDASQMQEAIEAKHEILSSTYLRFVNYENFPKKSE
ncbi:MAG: hypothetical protein ACXVCP_17685 [Bdellovibrio sp.]